MTRLHPVRAREVVHFLKSLGFVQVRQKGSHKVFGHPDGRMATVPDPRGEDLGRGILAKILRDAESSPHQFQTGLTR